MYSCSSFGRLKWGARPKVQPLLGEGASALDTLIVSAKPSRSVPLGSLHQQLSGQLRPPFPKYWRLPEAFPPPTPLVVRNHPFSLRHSWAPLPWMETRTLFPLHLNPIKRGQVATPQAA